MWGGADSLGITPFWGSPDNEPFVDAEGTNVDPTVLCAEGATPGSQDDAAALATLRWIGDSFHNRGLHTTPLLTKFFDPVNILQVKRELERRLSAKLGRRQHVNVDRTFGEFWVELAQFNTGLACLPRPDGSDLNLQVLNEILLKRTEYAYFWGARERERYVRWGLTACEPPPMPYVQNYVGGRKRSELPTLSTSSYTFSDSRRRFYDSAMLRIHGLQRCDGLPKQAPVRERCYVTVCGAPPRIGQGMNDCYLEPGNFVSG